MSVRRLILAAAVVCAFTYLKYFLPGFSDGFMPLLRQWLALDQVTLTVPEAVSAWLALP